MGKRHEPKWHRARRRRGRQAHEKMRRITVISIRETHVKSTTKSHLTPVRMGNIGQTGNHKYWTGCAERGTISKFNNFRGSHIHLKGTKGEGGMLPARLGSLGRDLRAGRGWGEEEQPRALGGLGGTSSPGPQATAPRPCPDIARCLHPNPSEQPRMGSAAPPRAPVEGPHTLPEPLL